MPLPQPAQQIDREHLSRLSRILTRHHALHVQGWDHRSPLLHGHMRLHELQPGMFLRLADVHDLYDLTSESELNPGLKVAVVLRGEARVAFGRRQLRLNCDTGPAVLVALDRTALFRRWGRRRGYERSLTLTLSPGWLRDRLGVLRASQLLHNRHLDVAGWQPSPAILSALDQLFDLQDATVSRARLLQLEGIALALLGEALTATGSSLACGKRPLQGCSGLLQRLWQLLDTDGAETLTQRELAAQLGISVSQLQRRFHDEAGMSLGSYLRLRRLETARHALAYERVSVEEAAARAGYSCAANFSTAFKRAFGITPSQCIRQGAAGAGRVSRPAGSESIGE